MIIKSPTWRPRPEDMHPGHSRKHVRMCVGCCGAMCAETTGNMVGAQQIELLCNACKLNYRSPFTNPTYHAAHQLATNREEVRDIGLHNSVVVCLYVKVI